MAVNDTTTKTLPGEVWKSVPGYNGNLFASNLGRIKSVDRYRMMRKSTGDTPRMVKGRILKQRLNKDGYLSTGLDGKGFFSHRAVCAAFHGAIPAGLVVNHINHNRSDNRARNLEAVSFRDNLNAAVQFHKTYGENHVRSKLSNSCVRAICARIIAGEAQKDIAKSFHVSVGTVSLIATGDVWKHMPEVRQCAAFHAKRRSKALKAKLRSNRMKELERKFKFFCAWFKPFSIKIRSLI